MDRSRRRGGYVSTTIHPILTIETTFSLKDIDEDIIHFQLHAKYVP
jgi:hypothetical protein